MQDYNLPILQSNNVHGCLQNSIKEKGVDEFGENRPDENSDPGGRSYGSSVTDSLQQMSGILDLQELSEEGKENRLKRRSSALYIPNFADGDRLKSSLVSFSEFTLSSFILATYLFCITRIPFFILGYIYSLYEVYPFYDLRYPSLYEM